MHRWVPAGWIVVCIASLTCAPVRADVNATFEDVPLGAATYWNGSDLTGGLRSQALHFGNEYSTTYGSWAGFACSQVNNTNTLYWTNQYAVISGTGVGGAGQYVVGYHGVADFDAYTVVVPTITLPVPCAVKGFYVNNTTYAALTLQRGYFGAKQFGGVSGDDPDWFKLIVTGRDAGGGVVGTNEVYLADFRSADPAQDYILTDWTWVSLTNLGPAVKSLEFTMDSSDTGTWGINTPTYFALDDFTTLESYAPAAGTPGSTAVFHTSNAIVAWATGWTNYTVGSNCDSKWQHPERALGPTEITQSDYGTNGIVCLGDAGRITLTFDPPIKDGPGNDFAVFENATGGFGAFFLECAWIEVSSDGINFHRLFNRSLIPQPMDSYDITLATDVSGLGCKYEAGYGEPYDLGELAGVATNIDLQNVRFMRVVDIVGDGSCTDSVGHAIYDPCPLWGSAGFDLDAVGVLSNNTEEVSIAATIPQGAEAGPWKAQFAVTRKSWSLQSSLVVHLAIAGTASNGVDYAAVPVTVTLPAGSRDATVTILPLADALAEGDETVKAEVLPDPAYSIGRTGSATAHLVEGFPTTVESWRAQSLQAGFDAIPLGGSGYWNGSDLTGGFFDGGAWFGNAYSTMYGSWAGFACSRVNNTNTLYWTNQYAVISGTGVGGAGQYVVGYHGVADFDAYTVVVPTITLPVPCAVKGFYVNNTTYAALTLQRGYFGAKQFGGVSGDDPDWFKLIVTGRDAGGGVVGTNEVYLADFRSADPAQDYILTDWTWVSLTNLGPAVKSLEFTMDSSDTGTWGINTPTYFALDGLEIDPTNAAAGDSADWNGDGTPNLMAYVLGRDMGTPLGGSPMTLQTTNDDGTVYFQVEYQRRHGLTDAALGVLYATNLAGAVWAGGPSHVQESVIRTEAGIDTVRARLLDSGTNTIGFVRLEATRP